jgi:hypothetical protein
VTSEKGLARVKVYGPQGDFECVVAAGTQLGGTPADVAVDARDRVLVLDGRRRLVRVFQEKSTTTEKAP